MGKTLRFIKTLLTHKVTYRFLFVIGSALGLSSGLQHLGELETIVCTLLGGCN
ncbi:MAG: hypothetical protein [Caudoviricetes sp.]|nr:MAG: hypothetical protein [Caudoviricetes sp.]